MSMLKEKFTLKQLLLVSAGGLCLGLGLLGAVLPLLPTTPFVLLALWCFARSSGRCHAWLLNHRYFGELLRNWQQHRGMTLQHKRRACLLLVLSFALSIALVAQLWLKVVLLAIGCTVFWHIWTLHRTEDEPRIDQKVLTAALWVVEHLRKITRPCERKA